jgi:hypothetical protein
METATEKITKFIYAELKKKVIALYPHKEPLYIDALMKGYVRNGWVIDRDAYCD